MTDNSNVSSLSNPETETDGKHLEMLRYVLSVTVRKTGIGSDSMYARLKKNFYPIYKRHPEALKGLYNQMTVLVNSNFNEEIKQIFDEENIAQLMNDIDKLIEKATVDEDKIAWRPSGDAAKDCLAHSMPKKLKRKEKLEKLVTELESVNKMLKDTHEKKQKKMLKTKQMREQVLNKWIRALDDIKKTDLHYIDNYLEHKDDLWDL